MISFCPGFINILKTKPDILFVVGVILIIGYMAIPISRRIKLPNIVIYLLFGLVMGNSVIKFIDEPMYKSLEIMIFCALSFIGFGVGGELKFDDIKNFGMTIPIITVFETFGKFTLVFLGMFLLTRDLPVSLVLAAISSASAPAGTVPVLWQYHAKGPLTTTILAIVGLDDALVLIIYAFASSFAKGLLAHGKTVSLTAMLAGPVFEIVGSVTVGVVIGFIFHNTLKRLGKKNEILLVTVGLIMLSAGIAKMFGLSLILTSMMLGITLINLSQRNQVVFEMLHRFDEPFYVIMFILLGAHLDIAQLPAIGFIGVVYVITRSLGLLSGAWLGAVVSKADDVIRKYLGFGLLSQAGVALGLALESSHAFAAISPKGAQLASLLVTIIAATCVIFELVGPIFVRYAIVKANEVDERYL